MLLCSNVTELKFLSTIFSSDFPKQINMFEFVNSIMSQIYRILFDELLPKVLEEMKSMMQSSPDDRIGDWFMYKDFTVLRVYGFTREPYRLPSFLTPRIFALEYMRQRLHVEEEHFGAFKKSSNIKFPLKVGSFIFKNKGALVFVEKLLESMDFQREQRINYDPYHIISLRKQENKNKPFDHQIVEGLNEIANLFYFMEIPGSDENTSS